MERGNLQQLQFEFVTDIPIYLNKLIKYIWYNCTNTIFMISRISHIRLNSLRPLRGRGLLGAPEKSGALGCSLVSLVVNPALIGKQPSKLETCTSLIWLAQSGPSQLMPDSSNELPTNENLARDGLLNFRDGQVGLSSINNFAMWIRLRKPSHLKLNLCYIRHRMVCW